jgi:uncharacterized protein
MRKALTIVLACIMASAFVSAANVPDVQSSAYQQDYTKWRKALDDSRHKNWLTLVGLFWLREGENRVGGDQKDEVPLPADKVPEQVGVIEFHAGKALFKAAPGASVTSDAKPVQTIELRPDNTDQPTVLQIGDVRMLLIQRENRFGMRVRDMHSKNLEEFKGTEFFPVQKSYVIDASFVPFDKPKTVPIATVLGQDAHMESPGYVEFTLNGQKIRLQAVTEGTPELMLIIKDKSSGKETYPAGRFIDTDPPKDGHVVIDFNRAYSPPCAFTAYATCPLPPRENWMPVAVEAGEKFAGH